MATLFKVNSPLTTTVNFVDVQNNLPAGVHVFQLVVVDNQGNHSNPVQARVVIAGTIVTGGGPVVVPVVGPVVNPAPILRPGT